MSSILSVTLLTEVFVTLFVIMDPIGTIPLFLSLTRGRSAASTRRAAWQAVTVSFAVIVAFAFFGQQILQRPGRGFEPGRVAGVELAAPVEAIELPHAEPQADPDDQDREHGEPDPARTCQEPQHRPVTGPSSPGSCCRRRPR